MNKVKLKSGLINLSTPFGSKIVDSRNNIEIIGAISLLPGSRNQKEPKIPIIIGIKKNFRNLFLISFNRKKHIKNRIT